MNETADLCFYGGKPLNPEESKRQRAFQATLRYLGKASGEHGSPEFRRNYVYPNHSSAPIQAFQLNEKICPTSLGTKQGPFVLTNGRSAATELSSVPKSLSQCEESVAKLSAMFPTVTETHIKLLLQKYLNREALVISALQVEKYPIITPGPFFTPPPQRNIHVTVKGPLSRTGSPLLGTFAASQGLRSSPKPHSSPKLKLRYMKSIFPEADETLILECLQNNETSIQKTSETLEEMGFVRKSNVKTVLAKAGAKEVEKTDNQNEKDDKSASAKTPKIKTSEEKQQMKQKLQEQYKDVPEHLISIALESVNFNESRADQILQIMKQEDNESHPNNQNSNGYVNKGGDEQNQSQIGALKSPNSFYLLPTSQSRQSIKSLLKTEKKETIFSFRRTLDDATKPKNLLSNTLGHNPSYCKGPNEKLLLENYVQWQGPNRAFYKGPQASVKGPNRALLSGKTYTPLGSNPDLRKGAGWAKKNAFAPSDSVLVEDFGFD